MSPFKVPTLSPCHLVTSSHPLLVSPSPPTSDFPHSPFLFFFPNPFPDRKNRKNPNAKIASKPEKSGKNGRNLVPNCKILIDLTRADFIDKDIIDVINEFLHHAHLKKITVEVKKSQYKLLHQLVIDQIPLKTQIA